MGKATVPLPPAAFLQATAAGEAALARLVSPLAPAPRASPTCSPASARSRCGSPSGQRVIAVDDDEDALAALKRAAAVDRRPQAASTSSARDLFRRPLTAAELKSFDAVVFDPPRQGAQAQARELAASGVPVDRRGVVQSGNVRPRHARACPRRLSADRDHAGRSIPLRRACRDRSAAGEVTWDQRLLCPPDVDFLPPSRNATKHQEETSPLPRKAATGVI